MSELIYYFDSSVFVSFFNNEQEKKRADIVEQVLNEAHAGRAQVITSSFALVEVLKLKGHAPLGKDDEDKLGHYQKHGQRFMIQSGIGNNPPQLEIDGYCPSPLRLIWKSRTQNPVS